MSFSDKDLKQMKLDAAGGCDEFNHEYVLAVIARLEAAEKAAEYADGCDKGEVDSCVMRLAIREWRKIKAGK